MAEGDLDYWIKELKQGYNTHRGLELTDRDCFEIYGLLKKR